MVFTKRILEEDDQMMGFVLHYLNLEWSVSSQPTRKKNDPYNFRLIKHIKNQILCKRKYYNYIELFVI